MTFKIEVSYTDSEYFGFNDRVTTVTDSEEAVRVYGAEIGAVLAALTLEEGSADRVTISNRDNSDAGGPGTGSAKPFEASAEFSDSIEVFCRVTLSEI